MFAENLSISLVQICKKEHLSYALAAKRCHCSSQHFANIIQQKSVPSIKILEQMCCAFHATPNELMRIAPSARRQPAFGPKRVTEVRLFHFPTGDSVFPVCPKCGSTLEREYQSYCDRCGQWLSWTELEKAHVLNG